MDEILAALAAQQQELAELLDGLSDGDWGLPSPCEGWSVADVVLHLAQTNELAIGSATGRFDEVIVELTAGIGPADDVDAGADGMVALERHLPPALIHRRWSDGSRELRTVLGAIGPHQRVTWVAGQLSARTLATTRLAETWIHTGDVAIAIGRPQQPTERLQHIARLAWRTLPYAFSRSGRALSGPVAFELTGPSGERWDFVPDESAVTTIRGTAADLCAVAGRRVEPAATSLGGDGPDVEAVLELVRTYA